MPQCIVGGPFIDLMNDPVVREQLNIPKSQKKAWDICEDRTGIFNYKMTPEGSQWIYEELTNSGIRMLKYSGDNDMVVSTAGTMRWIDGMNWNATDDWDYFHL